MVVYHTADMQTWQGFLTILECVMVGNGLACGVLYAFRALLYGDALHRRGAVGADLRHAKLAGKVAAWHKGPLRR